MKNYPILKILLLTPLLFITGLQTSKAQHAIKKDIEVGAYYFDGWSGASPYHLNAQLTDNFPERKPVWGWVTSTPDVIEKQISYAANAGVDFFNFCWYFKGTNIDSLDMDPKNNALKLYLKASNKSKVGFALMVANHQGYILKKEHWSKLIAYWCKLFKDPMYVKANGKPLITFFSVGTLITTFGSEDSVKMAFDQFNALAKANGLPGISIAASLIPAAKYMQQAKRCGFNIITRYNNHGDAFASIKNDIKKIDSMQVVDQNSWNKIKKGIDLPQMPVITLNYDPRPLYVNQKTIPSRLNGFSGNSIRQSIINVRKWINNNSANVTTEKIVNIYAWNEYGEGAWLTPSVMLKDSLINGLKSGLTSGTK